MNRQKLNKLRRELEQLRRGQHKAADLEHLATKLGRKFLKGAGSRGKEPMWVSTEFDDLFPLSIPRHGGQDLAIGTKNSILDQLELDLTAWDERLAEDDEEQQ
jgi:hypothetical protein